MNPQLLRLGAYVDDISVETEADLAFADDGLDNEAFEDVSDEQSTDEDEETDGLSRPKPGIYLPFVTQ